MKSEEMKAQREAELAETPVKVPSKRAQRVGELEQIVGQEQTMLAIIDKAGGFERFIKQADMNVGRLLEAKGE